MPEIQGSSSISAVDMGPNGLRVTFQSGKCYEYADVGQDVMLNMINADSAGKFFASEIRPNFEGVLVDDEVDHPDLANPGGENQ